VCRSLLFVYLVYMAMYISRRALRIFNALAAIERESARAHVCERARTRERERVRECVFIYICIYITHIECVFIYI